jgi:hypothetical protein
MPKPYNQKARDSETLPLSASANHRGHTAVS